MNDYDDYYDSAKKDGEPFIQGEFGGCIDRFGRPIDEGERADERQRDRIEERDERERQERW